jgi:ribosome maturation factor RimP
MQKYVRAPRRVESDSFFIRKQHVPDTELKDRVSEAISPIITGMGFKIVELRVNRSRKLVAIELIVYRSSGVSVDDCAEISRLVHPRIELIPECVDFMLKVSSPGIDRVFRSNAEFAIFAGNLVCLLFPEMSEWERGMIGQVTERGFTFIIGTQSRFVEFESVKKAKLDHSQGGFK